MGLNKPRDEAFRISKEHGFHDEPRNFGETMALIHSEVSEALEDYRAGRPVNVMFYGDPATGSMLKPNGIPSEMADIIIRVLDFCGANDIDIEKAVAEKMAYNESRPYKHGKKC